jgi:hypothetical protein
VGRQDLRSPWAWGFLPWDRVPVRGGTFAGMVGEVLAHEQAEQRLRPPAAFPASEGKLGLGAD